MISKILIKSKLIKKLMRGVEELDFLGCDLIFFSMRKIKDYLKPEKKILIN